MNRPKFIKICMILLFFMQYANNSYAINIAIQTHEDFIFTLESLRNIRVIIENFGNDDLKNQFNEIKTQFSSASEDYYGQNFTVSHQKFISLKEKIIAILENLTTMYIQRTKEILDSTSKTSFDIILKFGNAGGLKRYFIKPYNPVEEKKPYKEEEYHFFHDKATIEQYLHLGYERLQTARNIFNDPDIAVIKAKKRKTSDNIDYIIERYSAAISQCRQSKQYGIEIHKLLKYHQIGNILEKYSLTDKALDPIFDDRIPEDYKVDATDNIKSIYSIEKERLVNRSKIIIQP